jgi:hypothetical protein
MKSFNDFTGQITEVLKKSDPIEKWISDFVHSTNPKFAGKSKAERMDMAKGAYYGAQKNEGAAVSQNSTAEVSMNEDQYTSEYKIKYYVDPITGENKERKIRPHRINFKASKMRGEPAQKDAPGDYGMKEAVEYKGIGTDVVDKKKKLNPQPNFTTDKKTVKDFKEEALDEASKVYDPITKKMVARKPIKVQVGGGATRNGIPVETGPSKYKEKLNKEEVQIDEISNYTKHAYRQAAISDIQNKRKQLDTLEKHSMGHDDPHDEKRSETKANTVSKNVYFKNPGAKKDMDGPKDHDSAASYLAHKLSKRKAGMKRADESVQIDEVSKSTLMRYIPKASRDVGSHVYAGKEAGEWSSHYTRAGDWENAERQQKNAKKSFDKANKRIKGIDTATKKLGTQKEEVEIDESRGHKVLATFFKNREVAQRAFTGQNKPPVYSEKGIETPKAEKKPKDWASALNAESVEIKEGGFDNYHEIAKELVKRHGKNVDTSHINDLAGERDTHRGLDHSEVMHHVKKVLSSKDVKEGEEYDDTWKEYKGKTFKKESRMLNFKDFMKEALSPKQKKIAKIAGDKDKIDAHDLAALRAGKKPVEEASCSGNMKKEELVGNQHKLDKNKNGKLDAHDFKLLRKEEAEQLEEAKYGIDVHRNKLSKLLTHAGNAGIKAKVVSHNPNWEKQNAGGEHTVSLHGKDEHIRKFIQKHHDSDPQGTDDYKEYGKSLKESEQIDEISKKTLGSYVNKAAKDSRYSGQIATDFENQADKARKQSKKDSFERLHRKYLEKSWKREDGIAKAVNKLTKEEIELDEGRMKDLAYDLDNMGHSEFHKTYGNPKSHYDPTNFKKPVQPGKEMDRARALAQRGMQSLSKEEVERIEEKLAQLDELSLKTMKSAGDKLAGKALEFHYDDNKHYARVYAGKALKVRRGLERREYLASKGKYKLESVEHIDESAGDDLLQAAREYKDGSTEYHKRMIKYHDHMADVHHGKPKGKEHEEKIRHHESELNSLKEDMQTRPGLHAGKTAIVNKPGHPLHGKEVTVNGQVKMLHSDGGGTHTMISHNKVSSDIGANHLVYKNQTNEEKLAQLDELSPATLKSYKKGITRDLDRAADAYPHGTGDDKEDRKLNNRVKGDELASKKLKAKGVNPYSEEVEQEMSPYLKATLSVMDEGKIDDLRDAQRLRASEKSAYDKDYKADKSHPSVTVHKGTAYGGSAQKDDEPDEKPETKEKRGPGRPSGTSTGARLKGSKKDIDKDIDGREYSLHLPK